MISIRNSPLLTGAVITAFLVSGMSILVAQDAGQSRSAPSATPIPSPTVDPANDWRESVAGTESSTRYPAASTRLLQAKQMVKKALDLDPEDGYIMDSLAWVYFKLGQHKKALDIILQALKREPQDPVIHEHLVDIYMSLGKRSQAMEAYQKALDLQHTEPDKIKEKLRLVE